MKASGSGLTPRGQQWLATVREWERSGLSMREFCVRRGLKAPTLAWWRQEIKRLGGKDREKGRVELIEIAHGGTTSADCSFEIELANRLRVHVPARFDAAALKELLGVLASC
jgi:transposase-like protein